MDQEEDVPVMLVTANVGSIFEDPEVLLKEWVKEYLKTVKELKPKLVALHCQEVGGKNYEDSMKHVENFVRTLLESEELAEYSQVKVFLDEDFTSIEKFTALGNLYFMHASVTDWKLWDFNERVFVPATGQDIYSGNIEDIPLKQMAKFPPEFFPQFSKFSRKGFMRTRWSLGDLTFDLVNIHLFHDASNFVAMESFPSPYSKMRQNALQHILDRFEEDDLEKVPFFIFGDFNFRLNTGAVVERLTKNTTSECIKSAKNGETEKIVYKANDDATHLLTLQSKVFDLVNQEETFFEKSNHQWLLQHDNELNQFEDQLFEFEKTFPPSYPFTEDMDESANDSQVSYKMMGSSVPMGDHKPILLHFKLKAGRKLATGRGVQPIASCEGSSCVPHNDLSAEKRNQSLNRNVDDECPKNSPKLPDITTRYIYVQYDDRVSVFRETTV